MQPYLPRGRPRTWTAAFESVNDVVTEMNAEFATAGLGLVAAYSRGGDTLLTVTEGRADASITLAFSGAELAVSDLLVTSRLSAGAQPTETSVRVSDRYLDT